MHGKGVYSWADGRKYEGDYFNDKKNVNYNTFFNMKKCKNQINEINKKRVKEFMFGQMEGNMMDIGKMVNKMETESIY